jgi:ABC-type microcin C transport system permease subunit YejB
MMQEIESRDSPHVCSKAGEVCLVNFTNLTTVNCFNRRSGTGSNLNGTAPPESNTQWYSLYCTTVLLVVLSVASADISQTFVSSSLLRVVLSILLSLGRCHYRFSVVRVSHKSWLADSICYLTNLFVKSILARMASIFLYEYTRLDPREPLENDLE